MIVHSFANVAPPFTTHAVAFETTLKEAMGGAVDLDEVSLDMARYADADMQEAFVEYMLKRQAKWRPDMVVPIGSPAAVFVAEHRQRLFPDTTVVYCGLDKRRLKPEDLANRAVFIGEDFDIKGLMEDMLTIAPATTNVAVVIGASPVERYWTEAFRGEFNAFSNRVSCTWWNDLSFEQMLEQSRHLPPRSFIFMILLLRDAAGVTHNADDALRALRQVANAPINSIFDHQIGLGIVGGRLYRGEVEGREAAKVTARLFAGEPISSFPPKIIGPEGHTYDWRELQRWGIQRKNLPADSAIRFRLTPLWRRFLPELVLVTIALVAQTIVIVFLLINRRRRIAAEGSLRENQERMELAAEAGGLKLWEWDMLQDELQIADPAGSAGSKNGQGPQRVKYLLEIIHPEDRDLVTAELARASAGDGDYESVHRCLLAPGEVRWMHAKGRIEFDSQHRPVRMRGISMDITDRKLAEAKALESEGRLTHLTRVSTLGELGGSLAHELNQPLTAILSNAQAASRFLERDDHNLDEIRQILKDIVTEDKRAGEIIVRIRAMLKREEARLEKQDINEIVREVVGLMHSELLIRGVKVVMELAPGLPPIKGDKVRLQQVLINLVVNGCEAMSDTPVGAREITIRARPMDDGYLELAVTDRGPGFRASDTSEVFEPFRTTKPNGLGLGLPICRSIVEAHGGRLSAANHPDGGATVRFTLKCSEEAGT